ncbi:MAG: NAD(P)H-dependent oxidoreductase [bacterium]
MKILTFSSSLRKDSVNSALIGVVNKILEEQKCEVNTLHFSTFDMPLYNGDIESSSGVPKGALRFRDEMDNSDGIIISSPEYNYSVPGTLKNAIDWTSRITPKAFKGKHFFLMSASPALAGGARGLWHLRVPLEGLGSFVYPEMFSLFVNETTFNGHELSDKTLRTNLENNIKGFLNNINTRCK